MGVDPLICVSPLFYRNQFEYPYMDAFHPAIKHIYGYWVTSQYRWVFLRHPLFQLIIPDEQPCFDLTQISTLMEQVCSDCLNVYLCFLVDGRYV